MSDDILFDCETCDAAVRIAALEAENDKLRAALKPFADLSSHWEGDKMPLEPRTIIIDPLPVLYAVKETRND